MFTHYNKGSWVHFVAPFLEPRDGLIFGVASLSPGLTQLGLVSVPAPALFQEPWGSVQNISLRIRGLSEATCFCVAAAERRELQLEATFMRRLSFSLCLAALNVVPCLQEISEICVVLRLFAIFAMYFCFCLHVDLFCLDFVPACFFKMP